MYEVGSGLRLRRRRWGAALAAVYASLVLVQVRQRAEHPAAETADRAALVQRPVVSQGVPALERLVADRAAQSGRGDTCRAQQQRVRIAARRGRLELVARSRPCFKSFLVHKVATPAH